MTLQKKEHTLHQSVQQYQLEGWIKTIPGGFQIVRMFSEWKTALAFISLVVGLVKILNLYSQLEAGDSGWLTVFFLLILALVAFGFIFVLGRKVVFDLENGEIYVTLLGNPIFRRRLKDFTALSYLYGSTLYIEFNDKSKIRIVSLKPGKELENLQSFITEALRRETVLR